MSGIGRGVRLRAGERTVEFRVGAPESTLQRINDHVASLKPSRSRSAWALSVLEKELPPWDPEDPELKKT